MESREIGQQLEGYAVKGFFLQILSITACFCINENEQKEVGANPEYIKKLYKLIRKNFNTKMGKN